MLLLLKKQVKIQLKQLIHQIYRIYCKINSIQTWDNKPDVHKECRDYLKKLRTDKTNQKKNTEKIKQYLLN